MKNLRACHQAKITSSGSTSSLLDASVNFISTQSENYLCTDTCDLTEDSSSQHAIPPSDCKETMIQFTGEAQRLLLPINNDLSTSTSEPPHVELEESFTGSTDRQ